MVAPWARATGLEVFFGRLVQTGAGRAPSVVPLVIAGTAVALITVTVTQTAVHNSQKNETTTSRVAAIGDWALAVVGVSFENGLGVAVGTAYYYCNTVSHDSCR